MPLLMCPNCNSSMQAVQRAAVEFDMCPQCRGVWLDRGELEKLMAMSREEGGAVAPAAAQPPRPDYRPDPRDDYRRREHYRDDDDHHHYRHKKRRGFDLFDIFD